MQISMIPKWYKSSIRNGYNIYAMIMLVSYRINSEKSPDQIQNNSRLSLSITKLVTGLFHEVRFLF